jgi:uncharacterized protein (DUF1778 family)
MSERPSAPLYIRLTRDEVKQVKLAASLQGHTIEEYVKRAINAALRKQGVDAVLLKESDDE